MIKIAFDTNGADLGVQEAVKGAVEALDKIEKAHIALYGDENEIKLALTGLATQNLSDPRISVVHCSQRILPDDKPVESIRSKTDSSMVRALKDLKEGRVNAFVSGGNTGAVLAGGLFIVGRIKGINRPAICTIYPTEGAPSVLVDAGANAECKVRNLTEFAIMGSVYAEKILDVKNPTVGLINIGAESTKGTPLQIEAYQKLTELKSINFVGNVEGRQIPSGKINVLVTDGFTGNIILKLTEGVATALLNQVKSAFLSNTLSKVGALLVKKSLKKLKKNLDYTEYGGAPILGIDGLVVKAHGSSNAKAFSNAIKYAYIGVQTQIVGEIKQKLNEKVKDEV